MLVGPLWMSTAKLNNGWGLVTWNLGLFGAVAAVPVVRTRPYVSVHCRAERVRSANDDNIRSFSRADQS